jgi:hypothetical protein
MAQKEEGKKGKEGDRWHGHYGLPASSSSYPSRVPMCTTTGTCGSGGIRVLHAGDAKGGWCEFAGAGNTNSVRNLDVDKVEAADSLTGAVMVMVLVIIVIERIKCSRCKKVDGNRESDESSQCGWSSARTSR